HLKINSLSTTSTHFTGTLYELSTLKFLKDYLKVTGLVHSGGTSDNGIDIRGYWDLSQYVTLAKTENIEEEDIIKKKTIIVNGSRIKPLILKKLYNGNNPLKINLLVQCKAYQSKLPPTTIRELSGIFNYNVNNLNKNKSILMIVTPNTLTHQALREFNNCRFGMMLVNLKLLGLKDSKMDRFTIASYKGGTLDGFYLNPYCKAMLEGIDINTEMK
ncbi:hypothetical protein PACTADRAFT_25805, partial [Pachysolen tannophilus NRRL Y-2460]